MPKTLRLFFDVDRADEDVSLQDVAEQCGYDCAHPAVVDYDLRGVESRDGAEHLILWVAVAPDADPSRPELVMDIAAAFSLSHPTVCGYRLVSWDSLA